MAPDRGNGAQNEPYSDHDVSIADEALPAHDGTQEDGLIQNSSAQDARRLLADRASQPQNFTLRGILFGLLIGVVIAFSNTYFGLQTGWISGMTMPAALIGFAFFRAIQPMLKMAFSPVENVLIQTVAGSVGTMGLGCGFVGVIPAMQFLLHDYEMPSSGPLDLTFGRLCIWAIGICLFGVVFAVPLRKEVIIREKLKFPSGTATALMIGVLHGNNNDAKIVKQENEGEGRNDDSEEHQSLIQDTERRQREQQPFASEAEMLNQPDPPFSVGGTADWKLKIRNMTIAFAVSAAYTLFTYFVPQVRDIPIFGLHLAQTWLWTLNPSPAYVGQGIIMGPATTTHMLFGAILGWGILSPLAKMKHWATGPVSDWEKGSKGWIVWVSLGIMLADSIVSLGWLILKFLIYFARSQLPRFFRYMGSEDWEEDWEDFKEMLTWEEFRSRIKPSNFKNIFSWQSDQQARYSALPEEHGDNSNSLLDEAPANAATAYAGSKPHKSHNAKRSKANGEDEAEADAPPEHLVSWKAFFFWLVVSIILYYVSINVSFPKVIPFGLTTLALLLAIVLSIMGVRALGETDLNPVSGISKLTQLFFATLIPSDSRNGVVINLIAGAVSESGALQAGDLLQDLKAGHLLGAAPAAQFYGQLIGSVVGAVVCAGVYKLYTQVYVIPGPLFQIPTGFVWIFTARLVTGKGLPYMAGRFAIIFGGVFAVLTALRTKELKDFAARRYGWRREWQSFIPGGIAVAVGMYNTPSFTLARFAGGCINFYWTKWRRRDETNVVVLASGLILGEGLFSIVNLLLASGNVPHL